MLAKLVFDILAREAAVGTALSLCRAANSPEGILLAAGVFALVIIGTRRHGLMPHRNWRGAANESVLVFIGGFCLANLIGYYAYHP